MQKVGHTSRILSIEDNQAIEQERLDESGLMIWQWKQHTRWWWVPDRQVSQ